MCVVYISTCMNSTQTQTHTNFAHNWICWSEMCGTTSAIAWHHQMLNDYYVFISYSICYYYFICLPVIAIDENAMVKHLPATYSREWSFMRRNFCVPMCQTFQSATHVFGISKQWHSMSLITIIIDKHFEFSTPSITNPFTTIYPSTVGYISMSRWLKVKWKFSFPSNKHTSHSKTKC